MEQTLEERKKEFRETLKKSLVFMERPFYTGNRKYLSHESTWAIANTFPYYQSTNEVFNVRNNKWHALNGVLCLIVVFLSVVFGKAYKNVIAIIFLAIFSWQYFLGWESK